MTAAHAFWAARPEPSVAAEIPGVWARFMAEADALADVFDGRTTGEMQVVIPEAMARILGPFDDRIQWEFGPGSAAGSDKAHMLALSTELRQEDRPLVDALMAAAPDHPRLALTEPRPPAPDVERAAGQLLGRAGGRVQLTGARAEPSEHGTLDIVGIGPGVAERLGGEAGVAFSVLAGEAVERDWLGTTRGERQGGGLLGRLFGKRDEGADWLAAFHAEWTAALRSLRDAIPAEPFADQRADGGETLFRYDPALNDWQDDPRGDTITYATRHPDLAAARQAGIRIAACRYTRHAESFLGLRLARTEAQPFDQVTERGQVAEALDAALRARSLGGVWGEGHGQAHVYIDFTAGDIDAAIDTVRGVMAAEAVVAPGAILFDEAGLETRVLPLEP
ncbi:MAG: hypothetical protein AAFR52_21325 [Pseudomonadota bacterium]